jgi:hypothetical protein
MEIGDTVVQGHEGFTEGSHEYLVFEKVLLSVAKKYGLHPVSQRCWHLLPASSVTFLQADVHVSAGIRAGVVPAVM